MWCVWCGVQLIVNEQDRGTPSNFPPSAVAFVPQGRPATGHSQLLAVLVLAAHMPRRLMLAACWVAEELEKARDEDCASLVSPLIPESFEYYDPELQRYYPNATLRYRQTRTTAASLPSSRTGSVVTWCVSLGWAGGSSLWTWCLA